MSAGLRLPSWLRSGSRGFLAALLTASCGLVHCKPTPVVPPVTPPDGGSVPAGSPTTPLKTVFVIVMENNDWAAVHQASVAPYLNETLLPMASHAERYMNPPGLHPSEPNYLWLEAGDNLGIRDDRNPDTNHRATPLHLATQLTAAGISWKSYQEDITGTDCPLVPVARYAPKHNPFVFFDDVTDGNSTNSANCIAHVRPYAELAQDLQNGTVARYNFLTPNLCHDMHDCGIAEGDRWLAANVPAILASSAFQDGGVLFITWDEGEGDDGPIGLIAISPRAKGRGYSNEIPYTHSSLLRTVQEIFGVTPLLGDAAQATDLSDLFTAFP